MSFLKKVVAGIMSAAFLFTPLAGHAEYYGTLIEEEDGTYWYENGKKQGMPGDPKNITDVRYGIERGREIYDPMTDAWYWLDACYNGRVAKSKEVWFPYVYQDEIPGSTNGKWVRYDHWGRMVKGWCCLRTSVTNNLTGQTYDQWVLYLYKYNTGEMFYGFFGSINGKQMYFMPLIGTCVQEDVIMDFCALHPNEWCYDATNGEYIQLSKLGGRIGFDILSRLNPPKFS